MERRRGVNVRWKTPISGVCYSSPIIWADRDFLASAEPAKRGSSALLGLHRDLAPVDNEGPQSFVVYGLDRRSGNILWQQTAISGQPKVKRHPKSPAIPIPPPLPTAVTWSSPSAPKDFTLTPSKARDSGV